MTSLEQSLYTELANAEDARSFLKKALVLQYRRQGKVNIADFSRRAGFTSRSYLSEYLSGKKALSRESLQKIKTALKIPKQYVKIFILLVAKDQPGLFPETPENIPAKMEALKKAAYQQDAALSKIEDSDKIVCKRNLFRIYAGLGSEAQGASLAEISERTGLHLSEVNEGLQLLLQKNIVVLKNQRYYAISNQVDFLKIGVNQSFSLLVKDMASEIRMNAETILAQNENFLFYSAFSLQKHELPIFKEKLRDAIYGVMDQFQKDDGNHVQQVFLCSKD
jgi:transcriptional regulator with XRE-family HTH domain